jgi:hypothetical protein
MNIPTFWASAVAKVLVGEQPCLFSLWAPAVLTFDRRPREDSSALTVWKATHTAQLQAEVARLRGEGWTVDVERFFKVTGQTAALSGKCDAVCRQEGKRPFILDMKSGQPRESDVAQVLLEMVMLPMAFGTPILFEGRVVYTSHTVLCSVGMADKLRPRLMALLRELGSGTAPEKNPSRDACRYCSVPEPVCEVRYREDAAAVTEEF